MSMNVKTYRAKTMQEALALVREELGAKASVLRTRELPARGLSRWFGGGGVEVVASDNVTVPSRLPYSQPMVESWAVPRSHAGIDLTADPNDDLQMNKRLAAESLRLVAADIDSSLGLSKDWIRLSKALARIPLPVEFIDEVMAKIRHRLHHQTPPNYQTLWNACIQQIASEIPTAGPIVTTAGRQCCVVLVGPTGVGKTTALAKLASHFKLERNRRVGLITCDTYRVAAVEQLRTYAEILDVPLEVVTASQTIGAALGRLSHCEMVFVDTAGRNPNDSRQMTELQQLLQACRPDGVQLVVSAVASESNLQNAVEQFSVLRPMAMILTKLDEASGLGTLLPWIVQSKLPLSYATRGQAVPHDLEVVEPVEFTRSLLSTAI